MNFWKRWWSAKRRCPMSWSPIAGSHHRAPHLVDLTKGGQWAKFRCSYCGEEFILSAIEVADYDLELYLEMNGIEWRGATPQPEPRTHDVPASPSPNLFGTNLGALVGHQLVGNALSQSSGLTPWHGMPPQLPLHTSPMSLVDESPSASASDSSCSSTSKHTVEEQLKLDFDPICEPGS